MNRVELIAEIVEKQPLRLTPAGLAVSAVQLTHRSSQMEAGHARDITLEVPAVAIGAIAERLDGAAFAVPFRFTGFLAHKTRSGRSLVLHITEFNDLKKE